MKMVPNEENNNSLCNFAMMGNGGINSAQSNYITTDQPADKYRTWDLGKLDSAVCSSSAVPDMVLCHQWSQRSVGYHSGHLLFEPPHCSPLKWSC